MGFNSGFKGLKRNVFETCNKGKDVPFHSMQEHRRNRGTATLDLNTLDAELNPICHLLALLGAHPILHVRRIRVNLGTRWR